MLPFSALGSAGMQARAIMVSGMTAVQLGIYGDGTAAPHLREHSGLLISLSDMFRGPFCLTYIVALRSSFGLVPRSVLS